MIQNTTHITGMEGVEFLYAMSGKAIKLSRRIWKEVISLVTHWIERIMMDRIPRKIADGFLSMKIQSR